MKTIRETARDWVNGLTVSLWGKNLEDPDWKHVHRVAASIADEFGIPITIGPPVRDE